MPHFDAIIAGGGIAGSTAGAALADEGLRVLICESGLPDWRRLAGELMHPPAVADLDELGLLESLYAAGAAAVRGFAVVEEPSAPGMVLSYTDVPSGRSAGLAIEHAKLSRTLLSEVARRPRVTLWDRTRVLAYRAGDEQCRVSVRRSGSAEEVEAPLVISAEGRASKLRKSAGIGASVGPSTRMVGWKIPGGRLPHPGFGNIFIGGNAATLAYPISRDEVRVMFELERTDELEVVHERLEAIPEPLRTDIRVAMTTQPRTGAQIVRMTPDCFTSERIAIVGDAGGCVHPLSASGISFCTRDAIRLRDAVRTCRTNAHLDVAAALAAYEDVRRTPMRTRVLLSELIFEALTSPEAEMRLLRHGLFTYWRRSRHGRGATLGLLSTQHSDMGIVAREFWVVVLGAIAGIARGVVSPREMFPAVRDLVRRAAGFALDALEIRKPTTGPLPTQEAGGVPSGQ